MNDTRYVISVDLGGTWIRAAAVSADGTCGPIVRMPTGRQRAAETIADDVAGIIARVRGESPGRAAVVEAAVVGVPTVPDDDGVLTRGDNLPSMGGFPLGRYLEKAVKLPTALFNDANCFTAGEWWKGAGQGTRTFCGVTLGTGIGMGLIINGHGHPGAHGNAGEIWKSPVKEGFLEQVVSGGGLEDLYVKLSGRKAKGPELALFAKQGDASALKAYEKFGETLGQGLSWVVNTLDPECIVFGGSISQSFEFFREPLTETLRANTVTGQWVALKPSVLGDQAALLGAVMLYRDRKGVDVSRCGV